MSEGLKSAQEFLGKDFDKATAPFRPENRDLTRAQIREHEESKDAAKEALETAFPDVAPEVREAIITEAMGKLERVRIRGAASKEVKSFSGGIV